MRYSLVAAVGVVVVGVGVFMWPAQEPVSALCRTGNRSTTLEVPVRDRSGNQTSLHGYAGRVVLLNMWATWCPPCRLEMPTLHVLHERYRDAGVAVVGVSTEDTPEEIDALAQELLVEYPLYSATDAAESLEAHLGPVYGLPTTFLIAEDGRICEVITGLRSEQFFDELLSRYTTVSSMPTS